MIRQSYRIRLTAQTARQATRRRVPSHRTGLTWRRTRARIERWFNFRTVVQSAPTRRRVEILRAAARVFRDRGFAAAGMRDIAAPPTSRPATSTTTSAARTSSSTSARTARSTGCSRRWPRRGATAGRCRPAARARRRARALPARRGRRRGRAPRGRRPAAAPARAHRAKRDRYERGVRALVAGGIKRRRAARRRRRHRHARASSAR